MSSNPAITIGVTATDNASQILQGVDKSVQKTTSVVETEGAKVDSATGKISNRVKANFTQLAMSAATLGAGIVSFSTSFGTLEKAQLATDKSNLALVRSQERLRELQSSGKATAQDLAIAQETVRLNTEKLEQAQNSQSDTYANFFATVPLQLMSFGTSAIGMYTALTGAEITATGATSALSTAMTFLAAHPIILALMGISTLILLLVFNVGGLRDAVWGLGKTILEFLDRHFKPLADAIRWFVSGIQWLTGGLGSDLPSSVETAGASISNFADTTTQANLALDNTHMALTNVQTDLAVNIPAATASAVSALDTLENKLDTVSAKSGNHSSIRGNQSESAEGGLGFGMLGREAADARAKFGDVPLVRKGGKWVPKLDVALDNASDKQDRLIRQARSRGDSTNIDVVVVDQGHGKYDIEILRDGITLKKTRGQNIYGVG